MPARKAVIVGISGCSSSGKTTLCRLIRDIFPHTVILHEDDFYLPEVELPQRDGLLDWDCAESLSIPDIAKALDYIHHHGSFPPELESKEDRNSVGKCPVPDSVIASLKAEVAQWTSAGHPDHEILGSSTSSSAAPLSTTGAGPVPERALTICLFDGFLQYADVMETVERQLDLKIFLRASLEAAKARREARSGYVTLEGFWVDPPGYFDRIVWPNYVEAHRWLFEHDDVEGSFRTDVLEQRRIRVPASSPGGDTGLAHMDMTTMLEWAVRLLMDELPRLSR